MYLITMETAAAAAAAAPSAAAVEAESKSNSDSESINSQTGEPWLPMPKLPSPEMANNSPPAPPLLAKASSCSSPRRGTNTRTRKRMDQSRKRKARHVAINQIDSSRPFVGEEDDETYHTNNETIDTHHQVPMVGKKMRVYKGSSVASEKTDCLAHLPPVPRVGESIDTERDIAIGRANDDMSESRMSGILDDLDDYEEGRDHKPPINVVGTADGQFVTDIPNMVRGDEGWEDGIWLQYFSHLSSLFASQGHNNVRTDEEVTIDDGLKTVTRSLHRWVETQRYYYRRYKLGKKNAYITAERIQKLDAIGLRWDFSPEEDWNQKCSELKEYKKKHGNCNVPFQYEPNKQLGNWVINQRVFYRRYKQGQKNAKITAERVQKLEAIGFEWSAQHLSSRFTVNDEAWNQKYGELKEYRKKHGNCTVPRNNQQYKQLGNWVHNQRQYYSCHKQGQKNAKITAERIQKLEAIGFEWSARRGPARRQK